MKKFLLVFLAVPFFISPSASAETLHKSIAGISFTVPVDWTETKPSSAMRAFQFEIASESGEKMELAVFYFGRGAGGDVEMNIKRWKGQFTELSEEKSEKKIVRNIPLTTVYLAGKYQQTAGPMMSPLGEPKDQHALLGTIIEAPEGMVFMKMTGSEAAIALARPGFEQLIASIE